MSGKKEIQDALDWFASSNDDVGLMGGEVVIYVRNLGFYQVCGKIFADMIRAEVVCTYDELIEVYKEQQND